MNNYRVFCYIIPPIGKNFAIWRYPSSTIDLEKAIDYLKAALWLLEKTRHFDLNIILRGACWFTKGTCNYHLGRLAKAVECYDHALPIYTKAGVKLPSPNLFLGVADCLLWRGECKLRLKRRKEAEKDLKDALDISTKIGQQNNITRALKLLAKLWGETSASARALRKNVSFLENFSASSLKA